MIIKMITYARPHLRRWPSENNLFILACLLCSLPVWLPHFPPMVDLPQHAAQISLLLNIGNAEFPFSEEFQLNLFTPYLIGYALIMSVIPLFGIVAASKLVIWLALASFSFSTRFLLRHTGGDPYWAWLTFPVLYGFTYQWGFLNFLIAAPVGILFLGYVWKKRDKCDLRSSLLIVLMLYVLFFSHALIMALFSLIAVTYWSYTTKRWRDFVRCAWPMITLAPLVVAWLFLVSNNPQVSRSIVWDLSWINSSILYPASWIDPEKQGFGRVAGFLPRLLGERPNIYVTLLGIMLFALPFLAGGHITKTRIRLMPMFFITSLLLFFPSYFFGVAFIYQRYTQLALPLFLIMIDTQKNNLRVQRYLRILAPVIAFGWIAYMSMCALQFNKDSKGFETVLSNMEPHKRAKSMIFLREDSHSIAPTFVHFPAWYSAINIGITNPSFARYYQLPVVYKAGYSIGGLGSEFTPHKFDWKADEGYKYDYFVVRSPEDFGAYIFRTATCGIELVIHSGEWWLYRRDPQC